MLKNWWKYSRIRFYFLNAKINYSFWLKSKKIFKIKHYKKTINDFDVDVIGKAHFKVEKHSKRRFSGFLYENGLYDDNPGINKIERDVWKSWRKKGLIK